MTASETGTAGLTSAEVEQRIADGRVNRVDERTSRSLWHIFRANVLTLFNGIVFAGFGLLLLLGQWQDALFGVTALANALIGVVQELRAKQALDRLALLTTPSAHVLRDGREHVISVADVVQDDVLLLHAGDQVAADAEVLAATRLEIDQSLLTGESEPVAKRPGDGVLSGSIVVGGTASARVSAVGAESFANQLTNRARRYTVVNSELRNSANRILKWITWGIFPVVALVVNAQIQAHGGWATAFDNGSWRDAAVSSIAAVIAMIPLGLVLITSIAFAVSAAKLTAQNVLVQQLSAVEVLARVDVLCIDKTGTLTSGEIVFDNAHPIGPTPAEGWQQVLAWIGAAPAANGTARGLAVRFRDIPATAPTAQIEFSSARKWSAVSFPAGSVAPGSWVLGAPDMVFAAAAGELVSSSDRFAAQGLRTLVLAHSNAQLSTTANGEQDAVLPDALSPTALLTFRESIRPDAAETLDYFAEQGVRVHIISGDNPRTVAAIAHKVGLADSTGYDARELPEDPDHLAELLERERVLGRVEPSQKEGIVRALQHAGHVVAMTGDGVNDALAIKTADIGIAMQSGADATKAVAPIVLLDDRFSHLPGVMAEGRQVTANVERVSKLFLTKTSYAITLAIVCGIMLWTYPLLPRQLAVTDGITIGIPSFILALLPNARRYLPGFLRRSLSFAIPAGLIVSAALVTISARGQQIGASEDQIRTAAMIAVALIGIWVIVVISRPPSLIKVLLVLAMYAWLLLVFPFEIVRDFLQLEPLPPTLLATTLLACACGMVLVEVLRFWNQRWIARHNEQVSR